MKTHSLTSLMSACLLAVAALSGSAFAQLTGTITGSAVNAETGKALKNAQIVVSMTDFGAVTDRQGQFTISHVPPGRYRMIARMTNYKRAARDIEVIAGEITRVDYKLLERIFDLDKVVVTATLSEQEIKWVPAATEVITETEINEMGAKSVADALAEAQSLTLQEIPGQGTSASLRGLSTKHTLVLLDGRRVSTGFRNQIDLGEIPNSMIERIEIVRGPSSALYGSDAVGGVINIITRQPAEGITGRLGVRYGQSRYGEAKAPHLSGSLAGKSGRLGYSLTTSVDRKGLYDRDKSTAQTTGDEKNIASSSGKISLEVASDQKLTGGLEYSKTEREGVRTWGWGDGTRLADSQRRSVFLEYMGELRETTNLMFRGYQSHFEMDIDIIPLAGGPGGSPLIASGDKYHLDQDLYQLEGRWSELLAGRHQVTMGGDYRSEKRKDNNTLKESGRDVNNGAFFIQDQFQISEPLLLILGGRYDRHSDFGSEFSPKVSATWSANDNLRVKCSYGEGFRAPTICELYIEQSTKKRIERANPDLDAETSRSFEFGVEGENDVLSGKIMFFR
ncbi:MAG: TonB-dependent receptor, partial [Gemmatimonadota bacterium]|nr:TonB-dependent receptor [Gemmatimonadota bacterium]